MCPAVGRDRAHVRVARPDERATPVRAADCCFMGEMEDDEEHASCMLIVVMKSDVGIWMHFHALPHKGMRGPWEARKLLDARVQSCFPKIMLTTDSEPAIWGLKRSAIHLARQETAVDVVLEESNEYVCQTSHFLEQEVQAVERKVRTLKFSVEEQRGDVASQSSSSCLGSGIREHGHTGEG